VSELLHWNKIGKIGRLLADFFGFESIFVNYFVTELVVTLLHTSSIKTE